MQDDIYTLGTDELGETPSQMSWKDKGNQYLRDSLFGKTFGAVSGLGYNTGKWLNENVLRKKEHGGPVYNHKGMKVPGMRMGGNPSKHKNVPKDVQSIRASKYKGMIY